MSYKRIWIPLKKAALCLAMPLALFACNARAAVTYDFWVESATWISPLEALTADEFSFVQSTIANSFRVTLQDPVAGGTLHLYSYYLSEEYQGVEYSQSGLTVDGDVSRWGVLETLNPPSCYWHVEHCHFDVNLRSEGSGLTGIFDFRKPFLSYLDGNVLSLEGVGMNWAGLWVNGGLYELSDHEHDVLSLTGHWREVPIPATLALLGLGLTGLAALRRRH